MTAVQLDALASIAAYADHPSGFLAYNDGVEHFSTPSVPGVIAYRRRGGTVFTFGGPFAPAEHRAALLAEFRQRVVGARQRLVAAQVRAADLDLFAGPEWTVNQLGSSYSIDLTRFTLKGKPLAKIRQNMARAGREGVTVREVPAADPPAELDEIDRSWLRDKGWHVKRMTFLVGERTGRGIPHRRLFVAERDGAVIGYISYSPSYGTRPGWLYDLTRRTPQASVGTIELINHTALQAFTEEGAGWLHLGLTPFAGLGTEPANASPLLARMVPLIAERGSFVYPARSQQAFKLKWAPQVIEPEYVAFWGGPRPSSLWQLFRITNAI
ncbi:bifunctional lysylphosphatidylglycerol flippase/synthetase MprF [Kitasatospora sp. NPDC006697]|uniref:bifunctional lysylphosphatidylglycerol flippase/synthetase MprF n=1 Tax=Kitasatospora sp. NPDC006697 TaxID=3364020 RepID=UPI0036A1A5AA